MNKDKGLRKSENDLAAFIVGWLSKELGKGAEVKLESRTSKRNKFNRENVEKLAKKSITDISPVLEDIGNE